MSNRIVKHAAIGAAHRVGFVSGYGYVLAVKQAQSVSYRRATNGQKPKNEREQTRVS